MSLRTTRSPIRRVTTGLIAVLSVIAAVLAGTAGPAAAETVSGPVSVQVRHSLRCLIPQNYSLDNNVQIEQYYCGSFNAYWEFVTMTDGYYRIRYKGTNRCMAVSGASTENLARVLVATCAGAYTNDQWKPINRTSELGVDWYLLYNRHSGRCMNIRGGSTTEGTDVIQYTCDSTAKHERFTWSYWPL